MNKEEFLKTTSRIIYNEGGGSLAKRVLAALKAELGEPLAATIEESNFGQQCEVVIAGHDGLFGYCYRDEDGSASDRTPEDFARIVAKLLMLNVKVEQLAEGGSARTPGSIVASSTTSGNKESAPQPPASRPGEPLRAAAPRRLRRAQPRGLQSVASSVGVQGGTPCKLVQGAAPGRGILKWRESRRSRRLSK